MFHRPFHFVRDESALKDALFPSSGSAVPAARQHRVAARRCFSCGDFPAGDNTTIPCGHRTVFRQLRWRETKTTPSRARAPDGRLENPLMRNPTPYLKMRVLGAIDMAEGNTIAARIKAVSQMSFTDEEGHPRQFTWRTIQTWYSRYQ